MAGKFPSSILMLPLAALACAGPAAAHHSTAEFDYSKTVMLAGTVKEVQWQNPHSYVQVLVPDKDGKLQQWSVEIGSPNINVRLGWRKDSIKVGDRVSMNLAPARDGRTYGTLRVVQMADGRQFKGVAASVPAAGIIPPDAQ